MSSVEAFVPVNTCSDEFRSTGLLFVFHGDSLIVNDVGDVVWSAEDVHVSLRVFHTLEQRGYSIVSSTWVA